jgi:hypothetical protein
MFGFKLSRLELSHKVIETAIIRVLSAVRERFDEPELVDSEKARKNLGN